MKWGLTCIHFLSAQHISQKFKMKAVVWETVLECQHEAFISFSHLNFWVFCWWGAHGKILTFLYSHSQELCPAHHIKCQYSHNPQTQIRLTPLPCFIFSPWQLSPSIRLPMYTVYAYSTWWFNLWSHLVECKLHDTGVCQSRSLLHLLALGAGSGT